MKSGLLKTLHKDEKLVPGPAAQCLYSYINTYLSLPCRALRFFLHRHRTQIITEISNTVPPTAIAIIITKLISMHEKEGNFYQIRITTGLSIHTLTFYRGIAYCVTIDILGKVYYQKFSVPLYKRFHRTRFHVA